MRHLLPPLVVLTAAISSGVVHGLWTNRWGRSGAVEQASARLGDVALSLGDWEGRAQPQLSEREVAIAGINGSLLRKYVNRRTGQGVSVLIVCGRPGPVSVHTPDVCYRGAGYETTAEGRYTSGASAKGAFKVLTLRKQSATVPVHLRLMYAWGADGSWTAPDRPRLAFARKPALYKLYVIRELPSPNEPLDKGPAVAFLKVLLPELQRTLFTAS
jgi:hypothetical protein